MEDSVNPRKKISESSDKKASSNSIKDSAVKNNISTFEVDDSAMDVDLVKCNTTANDPSKELDGHKSDRVVLAPNAGQKVDNTQTENKSSVDVHGEEETEDIKLVYSEESNSDAAKIKARNTPLRTNDAPITCHKTPRRVQLITLSSPRELKK